MASLKKKVDDRKDKVRVAEKELGDILKSLSSLRAVEQVGGSGGGSCTERLFQQPEQS